LYQVLYFESLLFKNLSIITIDHTEIGWEVVEQTDLAQDSDKWWAGVDAVMDSVVL